MGQKISRTAEIIEHKGVQILLNDFTGLNGREIVDAIKENSRAMIDKTTPGRKDWLSVSVFTDCFFDDAALKALSRVREAMKPFFVAMAEVGMREVQKVGLDIAAKSSKTDIPYRFFDNVEEAKDWLVEMYTKHVSQKK
jgi:hypothetical protein